MLSPQKTFDFFKEKGINFFTGVPDSLLKNFCAYISDNVSNNSHIIAANEGNAIALGVGHFLGTGKPPIIYLQNSGLGNTINPLLSLADPEVYRIPLLLIIGWRGEPGIKDEPQHLKQGRVTVDLLNSVEIKTFEIGPETNNPLLVIEKAIDHMEKHQSPTSLLIKKGTFEEYKSNREEGFKYELTRESAIKKILSIVDDKSVIVSTTGMTSREVYECREASGESHEKDFLTVGSMGHTSSIAMGLALSQNDRKIICIDGDGSMLMHLGATAIQGVTNKSNFFHILINNAAHDSVGGQPTVANKINLTKIASACGYEHVEKVDNIKDLDNKLKALMQLENGSKFLEILVRKGARSNLGRPSTLPIENRNNFMNNLLS